ncbi:Mrp/NBP35 family ATP-binding protein [Bifidobacterium choloepi]|uniref:Iron-sulfur cluster carrier protein n=1 Tax=Bifidobacterium choloepi TaxID=2614131 RepID=A0A6I5NCF9_9BIFI|nr:Mrp/NBP35 family ATP-binding protein [Bifidobacterium choloepi]NEG70220.1 Mrp/NBP35 family ATP-binding protein [Bifidobacterium choloepi]
MNPIEEQIYTRLTKVIDPELGRSVTDLGMISGIHVTERTATGMPDDSRSDAPVHGSDGSDGDIAGDDSSVVNGDDSPVYDVDIDVELTVPGCPLSGTITNQINGAVSTYPDATLIPHIHVGSMSPDKLNRLVADLKAERRENPFTKPESKTRIFAIASGKGGVGKSSVTANLAATFAAMGYSTAVIDADIYGFSLPRLFGTHAQPTNLNGMLMPVTAWGVKLISIGMFAGSDRAILWRGPRLQRSLEQFLSDVWWGEPDVLLLDLAPGTGDMAISVAQALPNTELVVVTTPQPSASDIAVRSGLVALQMPMKKVRGVIENMSYYEHNGERLKIFGEGGGARVSSQLTRDLGYDVPLLARIPLEPEVREAGEMDGRPAVLNPDGSLRADGMGTVFAQIVHRLMDE